MRKLTPLHANHIKDADAPTQSIGSANHGLRVASADVEVVFRDLDKKLIAEIGKAEAVFGCVAWLTHEPILRALAKKKAVGIVVQKEDFLRPDSKAVGREKTRALYNAIEGFIRYYTDPTHHYDYAGSPESEAIRCVGYANNEKRAAMPRMHNKFLVFCKWLQRPGGEEGDFTWQSYAVWTGSFNLTYNASESLENAIIIRDPEISKAYFNEFGSIFGLSEPLNWTAEWVAPEHRIGS